jgi:hypothetical protein
MSIMSAYVEISFDNTDHRIPVRSPPSPPSFPHLALSPFLLSLSRSLSIHTPLPLVSSLLTYHCELVGIVCRLASLPNFLQGLFLIPLWCGV